MSVQYSDEDMPDIPSDPDAIKAMMQEPSAHYIGKAKKNMEREDSFQAMYGQRIAESVNQLSNNIHRDSDATEEEFANFNKQLQNNNSNNNNNNNNNNQPNSNSGNNKINLLNNNSNKNKNNANHQHNKTEVGSQGIPPDLDHQETIQPVGQHENMPSFQKHSTFMHTMSENENKQETEVKPSALTKKVVKHSMDESKTSADLIKSKQMLGKNGKITIQELPFSQDTHFKCQLFIEVSKDEDVHEEVIVWIKKSKTVEEFVQFIKSEWKAGLISKYVVQLFVADEDGDLDDDYPALQSDQILSSTGLNRFYLKIIVDELKDRSTIVGRFATLQEQEKKEYEIEKVDSLDAATIPHLPNTNINSDERTKCQCLIL